MGAWSRVAREAAGDDHSNEEKDSERWREDEKRSYASENASPYCRVIAGNPYPPCVSSHDSESYQNETEDCVLRVLLRGPTIDVSTKGETHSRYG